MTAEEKELMLKILCTMLPYGVIVKDRNGVHPLTIGNTELVDLFYGKCNIKPYLRPLSSMTEEEVNVLFKILKIDEEYGDWLKVNDIGIIQFFTEVGKDFYEIAAAFDYLNSIHVDYRGLIPMDLALPATEGMYK